MLGCYWNSVAAAMLGIGANRQWTEILPPKAFSPIAAGLHDRITKFFSIKPAINMSSHHLDINIDWF